MVCSDPHVNLVDLVTAMAKAIDLMSSAMADHHVRVAYLAYRIAEEAGMPADELDNIALAGSLHDIGAFSLSERFDLLAFEITCPSTHAQAGYLLLRDFQPFEQIANLIRFHHVQWDHGKGTKQNGAKVPAGSHILHLADRTAVLIVKDKPILSQADTICKTIVRNRDARFAPGFVDALLRCAAKDYFWLECISDSIEGIFRKRPDLHSLKVGLDDLVGFSSLLGRVIDFKSEFTAAHTSGLAATAVKLASFLQFSAHECQMMEIAAHFHDLGKLAIPSEILEKPGKLTEDEWQIMRTHAFYTYQILEPIDALGTIAAWGALHQERLNGSGYPFSYTADQLSLGSRIMAVADVFAAISEDRPYRKGMDRDEALAVLRDMVEKEELDANVVNVLAEHFDEIDYRRAEAHEKAVREYSRFRTELG